MLHTHFHDPGRYEVPFNGSMTLNLLSSARVSSQAPIGRGYQFPVVGRFVLEKLELLEQFDMPNSQLSSNEDRLSVYNDVIAPSSRYSALELDAPNAAVNPELSGQTFLLPAWIGEPDPIAMHQLEQLYHLSILLNRTLILPNVSKGRFGTCMKYDAATYYNFQPWSSALSFQEFRDYANKVSGGLNTAVMMFDARPPHAGSGFVPIESACSPPSLKLFVDPYYDPSKTKHNHCLKDRIPTLKFRSYSPVWIHLENPREFQVNSGVHCSIQGILQSRTLSTSVVRDLDLIDTNPDVIVVNWELRHSLFHIKGPGLSYALPWVISATQLGNTPVTILSWPTELEISSESACFHEVLSSLKGFVSLLYLTFRANEPRAIVAIGDYKAKMMKLLSQLEAAENLHNIQMASFLTIMGQRVAAHRGEEGKDDPAMIALVDRLVLQVASYELQIDEENCASNDARCSCTVQLHRLV
jgi:hypothetical protein